MRFELLALMPGPVPKVVIENFLNRRRIIRLRNAKLDTFLNYRLAFVAEGPGYIDLHPFARRALRDDLRLVAEGDFMDATTSREEIAWIHATAAGYYLDRLPLDRKDFTRMDADIIDGAMHHLLALRDVLSPDLRHHVAPRKSHEKEPEFRARMLALDVNDGEITRYCLDSIATRLLFDRYHSLTQFLGQFETKARILAYFFEGHTLNAENRTLTSVDLRRLLLEIGICWMHAGRLLIANRTVAACADLCKRTAGSMTLPAVIDDASARKAWLDRSEAVSTSCTILIRLGRNAEHVLKELDDDLQLARKIAEALLNDTGNKSEALVTLSRGARRIIARRAHVELLRGRVSTALEMFEQAVALERLNGRQWLVGDAGRRHIQALVRADRTSQAGIAQADAILRFNVDILSPQGERVTRQSNEVIPLLVQRSIIHRIRGEYQEAGGLLEEIMRHSFVRLGECTFAARSELDLERARLRIECGGVDSELVSTLQAALQRFGILIIWRMPANANCCSVRSSRAKIGIVAFEHARLTCGALVGCCVGQTLKRSATGAVRCRDLDGS